MSQAKLSICPSILAGDFAHLANEVRRVEESGADCLHLDVMDGHFVPNLTFGPLIVEAINRSTNLFLDVHLMMYNPYDYIERFVAAGADRITFHFEATEDVEDTLEFIRRCNVQAGLAFCPETSFDMIPKFVHQCDMILLMTVHPGFGGQTFKSEILEKIRLLRDFCDRNKIRHGGVVANDKQDIPPFEIQVDGGINDQTAKLCVENGANALVAGTHLFAAPSMRDAIEKLRQECKKGLLQIR